MIVNTRSSKLKNRRVSVGISANEKENSHVFIQFKILSDNEFESGVRTIRRKSRNSKNHICISEFAISVDSAVELIDCMITQLIKIKDRSKNA